jgi:hypothetical protein
MTDEDYFSIRNNLPNLRRKCEETQFGQLPSSVSFLHDLIASYNSIEDKAALYTLLLGECVRSQNIAAQVHYLRKQLRDLPDDPLSFVSLSLALADDRSSINEAVSLLTQGVSFARSKNELVKYCLTCQARLALKIDDYSLFNDAMRGLIGDSMNYREQDNQLEFDFLEDVDFERADPVLLERYRSLAS